MKKGKRTKRKYQRKATLVLLDITDINDNKKMGRAALVDISIDGAGFESHLEFKAGDNIVLRFTFPGQKIYVLEGIIRRVTDKTGITGIFAYGAQFKKMGFFDKINLRKLIFKVSKR